MDLSAFVCPNICMTQAGYLWQSEAWLQKYLQYNSVDLIDGDIRSIFFTLMLQVLANKDKEQGNWEKT